MSKLYVAKLIILDPNIKSYDYDSRIMIGGFKSESILVEKTLLGYKEVFTGHKFIKRKVLKHNDSNDNQEYPYCIVDFFASALFNAGETQFVLDATYSFPLREAEEIDAKRYIDDFENSALKRHYDEMERRVRDEKAAAETQQASRQKAKKLVSEYKNKSST